MLPHPILQIKKLRWEIQHRNPRLSTPSTEILLHQQSTWSSANITRGFLGAATGGGGMGDSDSPPGLGPQEGLQPHARLKAGQFYTSPAIGFSQILPLPHGRQSSPKPLFTKL